MSISSNNNNPHILVCPCPGSGHIIPILDLTHLLLSRGLIITVLVTPSELPLLQPLLSSHPSSSLQPLILSPPDSPPVSLHEFLAKLRASGELYNPLLQWFQSHPSPPVAIISDFFLGWTNQLATQLGVPRVVFWPSGAFASLVLEDVWREPPKNVDPDNENTILSFPKIPNSPTFPWWQLTHLTRQYEAGDPVWEFFRNGLLANTVSWGMLFNSFNELEGVYIDYIKKKLGNDQVWAVGPLLPNDDDSPVESTARGGSSVVPPHEVMTWLDEKSNESVVYVCFGSRVTLTDKQMDALAAALECSKVHFILCIKASDSGFIPDGFEDRVRGRGLIITGWAPQVAILRHGAVGAFVTHCGWNSVLEGVAAGVMLLMWPMGADQFSNTKLLVDQLGVAARVCEGGPQSVPDSAEFTQLLADSVSGNRAEKVGIKKLQDAASKAVNGGNSSKDLDMFVKKISEL